MYEAPASTHATIGRGIAEIARLRAALDCAIGNMMNAALDLEGGTTKAFAVKQINHAIDRARAALNESVTACSGQSPADTRTAT